MYINEYVEIITLQEELKNMIEQLKAVKDENTELKTDIDLYRKADVEKRRIILDKNEKIAKLEAKIEMLENDRKEGLLTCCNCSHKFQDRIKGLKDEVCKLNEEKQQAGDNLRNRIKDLEAEIDQLKSNPTTVDKENQELKKKVQELNDFIQRI